MATWSDIECNMSCLEELDKATLETFARVPPEPSSNPTYHQVYESAMRRIERRLRQFDSEGTRSSENRSDDGDDKWYKKPVGIVALGVVVGVVVMLIKLLFGL
jgi:hypothetical protein